jgi:transposase
MWEPYRLAVQAHVPNAAAKIVFDRFHVMRHVLEAMDQVRRNEQKERKQRGDQRLTGTKFLWLMTRVGTWTAGSPRCAISRRRFVGISTTS